MSLIDAFLFQMGCAIRWDRNSIHKVEALKHYFPKASAFFDIFSCIFTVKILNLNFLFFLFSFISKYLLIFSDMLVRFRNFLVHLFIISRVSCLILSKILVIQFNTLRIVAFKIHKFLFFLSLI